METFLRRELKETSLKIKSDGIVTEINGSFSILESRFI